MTEIQNGQLDRLPGETPKAFQALTDYCLLGPGRSLAKLLDRYRHQSDPEPSPETPPTLRLRTLKAWSIRWRWQARVAAFDQAQQEKDLAAWVDRQRALREREWDYAQRLLARAGQMLAFPLERETVTEYYDDGRPKTVIREPAGWSLRDVVPMLKTASELGRLAVGMETARAVGTIRVVYVDDPRMGEGGGDDDDV